MLGKIIFSYTEYTLEFIDYASKRIGIHIFILGQPVANLTTIAHTVYG
jgi:hypothetical protein